MVPQTLKGTYNPAIQSPLRHLMHLIIMKQNCYLKLFFVNPSETWASSKHPTDLESIHVPPQRSVWRKHESPPHQMPGSNLSQFLHFPVSFLPAMVSLYTLMALINWSSWHLNFSDLISTSSPFDSCKALISGDRVLASLFSLFSFNSFEVTGSPGLHHGPSPACSF